MDNRKDRGRTNGIRSNCKPACRLVTLFITRLPLMRTSPLIAVLVAWLLVVSGCGQTREIDPAIPQSGPLIGTWEYTGDDLVDAEAGVVRNFVIGDGTWYIPKTLTFKADGTSDNPRYHACHFWILDNQRLKLSVGNGNRTHQYEIIGDSLKLILPGPYDGTRQTLTFQRVSP